MRFGFLILAAELLVGCGGESTVEKAALEKCIENYSVYESFPASASSFDKSKAEALARGSCIQILNSDALFEQFAMVHFRSVVPEYDRYEILHTEVDQADDDSDRMLYLVARKKTGDNKNKMGFYAQMSDVPYKWKSEFFELAKDSPFQKY